MQMIEEKEGIGKEKKSETQKREERDWLVDFNGMLSCLVLFYSLGLENCVHCTFIFTFFV